MKSFFYFNINSLEYSYMTYLEVLVGQIYSCFKISFRKFSTTFLFLRKIILNVSYDIRFRIVLCLSFSKNIIKMKYSLFWKDIKYLNLLDRELKFKKKSNTNMSRQNTMKWLLSRKIKLHILYFYLYNVILQMYSTQTERKKEKRTIAIINPLKLHCNYTLVHFAIRKYPHSTFNHKF